MQILTSRSAPLVSENLSWGFFGTSQNFSGLSDSATATLYDRAGQQLLLSGQFGDRDAVVEFLDSRLGRHFADALTFHVSGRPTLDQLTAAVAVELTKSLAHWVKWNRKFSR